MKRKFGLMDAVKTELVPKGLKPKLKKYTPPSDDSIHDRTMCKGLSGCMSAGLVCMPLLMQGNSNIWPVAAPTAYLMVDCVAEGIEQSLNENEKDVHYPLATFPVEVGYLGYKGLKNLFGIGKYNKQNSF